jgi:hypothetical protein
MNTSMKRFLFWMPRILGILFAIFISIFALDVFDEGHSFGTILLALLVHLIPTYIIVVVLIIAWRWEGVGAILFMALAVLYIALAGARFHWAVYATIPGPLVLLAILFLLNWIYKAHIRTS